MPSDTTSPGTSSVTGTRICVSVPPDVGFLTNLGTETRHSRLCSVFVEEAKAHAQGDDHGNDQGVRATTGQTRNERRAEKEDQDRISDLTEEDGRGSHPVRAESIRPKVLKPSCHLVGGKPIGATSHSMEHFVRRETGGVGQAHLPNMSEGHLDHPARRSVSSTPRRMAMSGGRRRRPPFVVATEIKIATVAVSMRPAEVGIPMCAFLLGPRIGVGLGRGFRRRRVRGPVTVQWRARSRARHVGDGEWCHGVRPCRVSLATVMVGASWRR